jgi:membrane protein YdbS with pleckstrin-like domain
VLRQRRVLLWIPGPYSYQYWHLWLSHVEKYATTAAAVFREKREGVVVALMAWLTSFFPARNIAGLQSRTRQASGESKGLHRTHQPFPCHTLGQMLGPPQLGTFLRIVPAHYEHDFWQHSQQHRRLASSLDCWTLLFTFQNCLLVLRYVNMTGEMMVEGGSHKFSCTALMVVAVVQAVWRLLAPSQYFRWRLHVVIGNRYARLLRTTNDFLSRSTGVLARTTTAG